MPLSLLGEARLGQELAMPILLRLHAPAGGLEPWVSFKWGSYNSFKGV